MHWKVHEKIIFHKFAFGCENVDIFYYVFLDFTLDAFISTFIHFRFIFLKPDPSHKTDLEHYSITTDIKVLIKVLIIVLFIYDSFCLFINCEGF